MAEHSVYCYKLRLTNLMQIEQKLMHHKLQNTLGKQNHTILTQTYNANLQWLNYCMNVV